MKILIVGAGSVGQVYGYHAYLSGAEVTFFVKKEYIDVTGKGFFLYPINGKNYLHNPVHFKNFGVTSVLSDGYDLIIICVSSTGLRGDWIKELSSKMGQASIILLQPGFDDLNFLISQNVPSTKVISGAISLVSYSTSSMEDNIPVQGTAYWFFPFLKFPFSGEKKQTKEIVSQFNKGKMPSKVVDDVHKSLAASNAILNIFLASLEICQWDIGRLSTSHGELKLFRESCIEAVKTVDKVLGQKSLMLLLLINLFHSITLKLMVLSSRFIFPFNVEKYLKVHFTKVSDQTRHAIKTYAELSKRQGQDSCGLYSLLDRLN